jgi:hypothetical protein
MKNYTSKITMEAHSEEEVRIKILALTVLAAKLKANELAKLAEVVTKSPSKVAMAKMYFGL